MAFARPQHQAMRTQADGVAVMIFGTVMDRELLQKLSRRAYRAWGVHWRPRRARPLHLLLPWPGAAPSGARSWHRWLCWPRPFPASPYRCGFAKRPGLHRVNSRGGAEGWAWKNPSRMKGGARTRRPRFQTAERVVGLAPRASGWMSKFTFWPSLRVRRPAASTAETWTNTSLPPPSGEMKPKPLVALKNFTVPMVIEFSFWSSGSVPATCGNGRGNKQIGVGWEDLRFVRRAFSRKRAGQKD